MAIAYPRDVRIAVAVLVAACGGSSGPPDACWPLGGTPGGTVELGTGDAFKPMPDVMSIEMSLGQNNGPFLRIQARARDIQPGDPDDLFSVANPRTKFSAEIADLGLTIGVDCPAHMPYVPSPEPGTFELKYAFMLGFGDIPTATRADGKRAHITLEVVGIDGVSASTAKDVTLKLTGF